jgi:LysR family tcuABC transcriptional regulator
VALDMRVEPLLDEELFVILPRHSRLVAARRASLSIEEAAALPLILPTGAHGLRRRIAAEFEQRGLSARVVAEIDSLALLMNCVYEGMGATIKPMAAVFHEGERGRQWRALSITGARMRRPNYLYSLAPERQTPAAALVAAGLKDTVRELIDSGAWTGVEAIEPIRV